MAIEQRQKRNEYLDRIHCFLTAKATIGLLSSAFNDKEIAIDDLIGKYEEEKPVEVDTSEWKNAAKQIGLKT